MHIEDLKVWHWVILGLVVGALFSGVKLWQGPWFDSTDIDSIEQVRFEKGLVGVLAGGSSVHGNLTAQYHKDQPILKDIVVHPPLPGDTVQRYWVTGKVCTVDLNRKNPKDPASPIVPVEMWTPFKYPAKVPYEPLSALELQAKRGRAGAKALADARAKAATQPSAAGRSEYPNVIEYLQAVHTRSDAQFSYRYAWQELPLATALLPPVAGLLVIGIAWPMTLNLMMGAGLARKPQPRAKLPKNRKALAAKGPVDTSAGDKQLADLNAALEAEMSGFVGANITNDPDESRAGMPAIKPRTLSGVVDPTLPKPEDDEIEVKEFGGEFYPVVKAVHKEHKHHDEVTANQDPAKK